MQKYYGNDTHYHIGIKMKQLQENIRFTLEGRQAVYRRGDHEEHVVNTPVIYGSFCNDYADSFVVSPGLSVYTADFPAETEVRTEFEIASGFCSFNCILSGRMHRTIEDGDVHDVDAGNTLFLGCTGSEKGTAYKHRGRRMKMVSMFFDPAVLRLTLNDCGADIWPEYSALTCGSELSGDNITGRKEMSGLMVSKAERIVSSPVREARDRLVVGGLVNDLFLHIVTEILLMPRKSFENSFLYRDLDRFKEAREILIRELSSPPSMDELARMTGLNSFKLKIGFRELYGTTVYGFVRSERMNWSKNLLESGRYNVSEAAWEVGYTNVSHFISCFRKHFHISPGEYLNSSLLNKSVS